jgi:membrane fusion protein, copper/silver efflux system
MRQTACFWVLMALIGVLLVVGGCQEPKAKSPDASAVWTCSMHPQVRQDHPGRCPICGMDLVPVRSEKPSKTTDTSSATPKATAAEVPGHATVIIPGELQQRIGVRIGRVEKGPLKMNVDALGIVEPDETRVARVSIKTEGWVDKLFVNFVGQTVRKGDPLLSIYSPQFLSTQQELLSSLRAERTMGDSQQPLSGAARRRLELWDVPADEINELVQTGRTRKDLVLRSPISGTVLKKMVFEKQYVTPEKELYVIGDLSTVWIEAKVYEYEIPHVELGQPATVTIPSSPNRAFVGKVAFIQPIVEEVSRTVPVRIELPNREGIFKPGMFAQVSILHPMGDGLLVPTSAILRTGERDIAYRVEPGDHFVPVEVKISPIQFGRRYQILGGLKEGEQVVISANFLIDSESRIRLGGGGAP